MADETKPNIPPMPSGPNISEIVKKGNEIYLKLKPELEPVQNGKYVAIEVSSEKYLLGDTRDEAVAKLRAEFPDKLLFVKRIGGVDKAARHNSHYSRYNYARIL